jgi:tetratricopeptide (TPR) repeat protein
VAILQAWYGQEAAYEATRRRVIQEAEGMDDAGAAERAAKAYCLRPSTNAVLSAKALSLARRAVELGQNNGFLRYYELCVGLAEYRNSHFATAEETLVKMEQSLGEHPDDQGSYIQGTARFFRVMILSKENRPEEARKLFNQAEKDMPPFPKDERKPVLDGKRAFHEVLVCWLSYKEAKALIESPLAPFSAPSAPR